MANGIDFLQLVGWCLAVSAAFMSVAFFVSQVVKRTDLVDVAWGPAFVAIAYAAILINGSTTWAGWLTFALVILWAVRLYLHLIPRYLRANTEDQRYINVRAAWPQQVIGLQTYVRIFLVQAVAALIISLPVIAVIYAGTVSEIVVWVGAAIWLVGFVIESIADRQLVRFITNKNNHGKLMDRGLWRYSRHPNYFGEVVQWWGIWVLSLGTENWFIALSGPLLITLLIGFISGVPLTEKSMAKKPGWQSYQRRISVLIPWPPKK